jgi:hypothetical protein
MSKLKTTFYELGGGSLNDDDRQSNIARLFGIEFERIQELWYGSKLSVDEFNKLGRCPAVLVPDSIWQALRQEVIDTFLMFEVDTEQVIGDLDLAARNDWEGIEDDAVLSKPARIMTPFTRVRPRRLMQSIRNEGLLSNELINFARMCYRSNFTTVRFVATVTFWLASPKRARDELETLLKMGGFKMDSRQWVASAKKHHELVKVMRRSVLHEGLLDADTAITMTYFQSLSARDQYMTQEQFNKEVLNRQLTPTDYHDEGHNVDNFQKDFTELVSQELTATGKLKAATTWLSFTDEVYLKLPGGSTSLPDKAKLGDFGEVAGLEGSEKLRLSGNKRLRAELDPILNFITFGTWVVYAFLKYEVSKVRYLYPANFQYTVLGLYIMNHMYDAFQSISGIDMGHNIFGSIAVKLSVLSMVVKGACGVNCDGKGFNENHSWNDMRMVYDCCRFTGYGSDPHAYQNLMQAIDKYVWSLKERQVVLGKIKPVLESTTFLVYHTLFSGEATTQLVNTMLLFGLAALGSRAAIRSGRVAWVRLFLKGDDLNAFCGNWLEGVALLHHVSFQGMLMEPSKDHVEPSQSEHERCLVTVNGYQGSLARRIGAAVAAEPQGSRGLTLMETLTTMAEHHQSMICRRANPRVVEMFSKAMIMTFLAENSVPNRFWSALFRPKVTGGFGIWHGSNTYYGKAGTMPSVVTRVKLKFGGNLSVFGSALMTDPLISGLAERFNVDTDQLATERNEMVSDALESALGPDKYGDRRMKNVQEVMSYLLKTPTSRDEKLTLDGASRSKAFTLANELKQLLDSNEGLRYFQSCTPSDVITRQLAKSGCVNANLYKRLHGISRGDQDAYIKRLIDSVSYGAEASVVYGLSHLPFMEAKLFYEDKFDVAFWNIDDKVNTEVQTIVRSFVLQRVAESHYVWTLGSTRQVNIHVKWELILTEIACILWERNRTKLTMISF